VIAAVTDTDLVTFVVQTHTIKSEDFQAIIPGAVEELRRKLEAGNNYFVLFYDNATVHRTQAVRDELVRNHCLAIHNCPYSPDLNFCEKFIRLHKAKLQEHLQKL